MPVKEMKISYYLKNPVICPLCGTVSKREELLSGGGRFIAADLTDELRRIYEPSKKFGEIFPLSYPITVCPACFYATYHDDFILITPKHRPAALSQKVKRVREIKMIFPDIDFNRPRDLISGTSSYLLAIASYSFHTKECAPTFKKGLSALRGAWSFDDLHAKDQNQGFDRFRNILYRKAVDYYEKSIAYSQNGQEHIDGIKNFGPDLDKNYGFQGVLYMSTLLLYKYGSDENREERIQKLMGAKRVISKVFGSVKSSKSKPSFILEISKELYAKVGEKIEGLKGE